MLIQNSQNFKKIIIVLILLLQVSVKSDVLDYTGEEFYIPYTGDVYCMEIVGDDFWVGTGDGIVILDNEYNIKKHIYEFPECEVKYPTVNNIKYNPLNGEIWCSLIALDHTYYGDDYVGIPYKYNGSSWEKILRNDGVRLNISKLFVSSRGAIYFIDGNEYSDSYVYEYMGDSLAHIMQDGKRLSVLAITEDSQGRIIFYKSGEITRDGVLYKDNFHTNNFEGCHIDHNDNLIIQSHTKAGPGFPGYCFINQYEWNDTISYVNNFKIENLDAQITSRMFHATDNNKLFIIQAHPRMENSQNVSDEYHLFANGIPVDTIIVDSFPELNNYSDLIFTKDFEHIYFRSTHGMALLDKNSFVKSIDTRIYKIPRNFTDIVFDKENNPILWGYSSGTYNSSIVQILSSKSIRVIDELGNTPFSYMAKDSNNVLIVTGINDDNTMGQFSIDGDKHLMENVQSSFTPLPSAIDKEGILWAFYCGFEKKSFIAQYNGTWKYYYSIPEENFILPIKDSTARVDRIVVQGDMLWLERYNSDPIIINVKNKIVDTLLGRGQDFTLVENDVWLSDDDGVSSLDKNGNEKNRRNICPRYGNVISLKEFNNKLYAMTDEWGNDTIHIINTNLPDESNDSIFSLQQKKKGFAFDTFGALWVLSSSGRVSKTFYNFLPVMNKKPIIKNSCTINYYSIKGKLILTNLQANNNIRISLKNLKGQTVFNRVIDYKGRQAIIGLSDLASGMYVVCVQSNDVLIDTRKIFIEKCGCSY